MAIRIVEYDERWREDFAQLNIEWLEQWFSVEPIDLEVLGDPETHILRDGGNVLFAIDENDVAIGCVALRHHGDGTYELTKMSVAPNLRGAGIGRLLMQAALAAFQANSGRMLYLESNQKLEPALALYESAGFVHRDRPDGPSKYTRSNVYMVWEQS